MLMWRKGLGNNEFPNRLFDSPNNSLRVIDIFLKLKSITNNNEVVGEKYDY